MVPCFRFRSLLVVALLIGGAAAETPDKAASAASPFVPARAIGGHGFLLLGSGVRVVEENKRYLMALYVDELSARRAFSALVARAGGRDHHHLVAGDHSQTFVIWGHFTKLAVLRFVRPVTAQALRDELKEGFDAELGPSAQRKEGSVGEEYQALLALFDRDLQAGQEIEVRSDDDGQLGLVVAGQKLTGPKSPKLARALWSVWLGARAPDAELRRALIDRVELLGK
jgi:hypothetical protein